MDIQKETSYSLSNYAQTEQIKDLILKIEQAAAQRNVSQLENYLHQDYQVIANRFKNTKGTTILSRKTYLSMMEEGKIGGTNYQTEFKQISITRHTALVELIFHSEKSSPMHKYLFLVQNENDEWKVVSDLPIELL
jgi:hypothetical protein